MAAVDISIRVTESDEAAENASVSNMDSIHCYQSLRVLFLKAQQRADDELDGPLESRPMGRGTPSKTLQGQELQPSRKRIAVVFEEDAEPDLLLDVTPTEAQRELVSVFSHKAPENADQLSLELTEVVERSGVLAGYSSYAIALACAHVAAQTLFGEIFDANGPQKLQNHYHGSRSAYNKLWLYRMELHKLVSNHGGELWGLHSPRDAKGYKDEGYLRIAKEGRSLRDPIPPREYRKSPLRHVSSPPTTEELILERREDRAARKHQGPPDELWGMYRFGSNTKIQHDRDDQWETNEPNGQASKKAKKSGRAKKRSKREPSECVLT